MTRLLMILDTLSGAPVPRDIPLPMPLPEWLLVGLLVFSFLLHILFVNLMVGGSVLTWWLQRKSLKHNEPAYDSLAREIAATITVNKSLAVVIGVAPLLTINTLYTVFFYSANALTGFVWISIVPIVTAAFLLLYYHKYSWDRYGETKKKFHIGINMAAALLLLFVPLIFLTNINLMQFPQAWSGVKGFFSAMFMRNVIFRYFHFLCASMAITGLFLFWYMKRKRYEFEEKIPGFTRQKALKMFYGLALGASLLQLVLGPLNLFTLPWDAVNWNFATWIIIGATFALLAMFMIYKEIKGPEENLGRRFYPIAAILTITVVFMGTARQIYRATALAPHQKAIEKKMSTPPYTPKKPAPKPTAKL